MFLEPQFVYNVEFLSLILLLLLLLYHYGALII